MAILTSDPMPNIESIVRQINNLEINEQVLYARMINVEQTTLIT